MEKFTNIYVIKEEGIKKRNVYIGIVILLVGLLVLLANILIVPRLLKDAKNLNDYIMSDEINKLNKITTLKIYYEPVMVADSNKGDDFYVVSDEKYFYIVKMNNSFASSLTEEKVKDGYVLKGITKSIPYDVKNFTLESYNKSFPESPISINDFDKMFGDILIEAKSNNFELEPISYYSFIISIIFGGVFFVISFFSKKSFEKKINSLDESLLIRLDTEMNRSSALYYNHSNFYLTDSFLINVSNLDYIEIDKLFLLYTHITRRNGIENDNAIKNVDT